MKNECVIPELTINDAGIENKTKLLNYTLLNLKLQDHKVHSLSRK